MRAARKREKIGVDEHGRVMNPARRRKTMLKAKFGITTGRQWKKLVRTMRAQARKGRDA